MAQSQKLTLNEKPFTDLEFPPNLNSLLETDNRNGGLDKSTAEFYQKVIWKRSSKIWTQEQLTLLPKNGKISPNAFRQGKLAN